MAEKKTQSVLADAAKSRRWAWIFIAAMLWMNLLFLIDYRHGLGRGYTDFTVFYTAGTILREGHGHQLYDRQTQYEVQEAFAGHIPFRRGPLPYIHPPFEALIFVPLSRLPYPRAFLAWDVLMAAALFGVGILLRRSVSALHAIPSWKFVLASVAFYPVFACLLQGQDSILQLLLCALAFSALKKNADLRAGGWLALAAFKFQFMIPVVLLLLLWNRRRVALGFASVALVLTIISLAIAGRSTLVSYPRLATQVVESPNLGGVPLSLLPNLHGLASGWPKVFSASTGLLLAVAASLLVFGLAARVGSVKGWTQNPRTLPLQFSLAIVVAVLVGWQTNAHDLSLLILPLLLLADYSFRGDERRLGFSLLLPALPLLISPLWMWLWLGVGMVNLMAIPLLWWAYRIGRELSFAG